MRKILCFVVCMLTFATACAKRAFYHGRQSVVQSLEEFVDVAVPAHERAEFNQFYRDMNAMQHKKRAEVRQRVRSELQQHAMNALEVKQPEWAVALNEDKDSKSAQIFLTRYGILEEYYKDRAQKTGNTWSKVVTFGKNVKSKASNALTYVKKHVLRRDRAATA